MFILLFFVIDYAFVRAGVDRRWFKCNDGIVTSCSFDVVRAAGLGGAAPTQSAAYCLVYAAQSYVAESNALSDADIAAYFDAKFLKSMREIEN